jgi:hypothetical protein
MSLTRLANKGCASVWNGIKDVGWSTMATKLTTPKDIGVQELYKESLWKAIRKVIRKAMDRTLANVGL